MNRSHNPERFKSPNDIHDNPTFIDMEKEIEEEDLKRNIRLHFDTTKLNKESEKLLKQCEIEILICLKAWKETINALIKEDKKISKQIKKWLETRNTNLPTFDVYKKEEAELVLKNLGFEKEKITKGNFLLVFNLPKPLNQYWRRNDNLKTLKKKSEDVQKMVITWQEIYKHLTYSMWNIINSSALAIKRINPQNIHDQERYHYIWDIGAYSSHDDNVQKTFPPETEG